MKYNKICSEFWKNIVAFVISSSGPEATRGNTDPIGGMKINTQDTNYSTGGMLQITLDTNNFTGEMLITTQDTIYSIGGMLQITLGTN